MLAFSDVQETYDLFQGGVDAAPSVPDPGNDGILSAAELRQAKDGSKVRVAGVVTHRQRPATASGVTFMNLEDETGMTNIVISVGAWNHHAKIARSAAAIIVRGRVQRTGQVVNLNAEHPEPLLLTAKTKSRDFR